MTGLGRRLSDVLLPTEDAARARSRAVVLAAYGPPARRRRRRWPAALAALVVLVPAGPAVAGWVADLVSPPDAAPSLGRLPAAGRILAVAGDSAWVVRNDGSRRRLGSFDDATWSPRGLFVAATRGRQLVTMEPDGDIRWALSRPQGVTDPRWAPPDGFLVAYRAGPELRLVAGDGTGDRVLAPDVAPVAPAWAPHGHVLALAEAARLVTVVDADTDRLLWHRRTRADVVGLQWAGSRLLVVDRRGASVAQGRLLRRVNAPAGATVTGGALSPDGRHVALAWRSGATSTIALDGRVLLAAGGTVDPPVFAPDGRYVVTGWPATDQWLFLPAGAGRTRAVGDIAEQFHTGGGARVAGWCC